MKRILPYLIIPSAIILVVIVTTKFDSLYMSQIDYMSQHSVFPDYFRKLFYETHQLLPSYAFNIGAGQNIYNFSYYGLLNPVVLLSYLLPFVDMAVYLMTATVVLQIASGILLYRLLVKIGSKHPLLLALLFALAASITFHSHRHWMFVSYMPFLILALHGVETYMKNGKSWLYLLSVFLILMTSYYFVLPSVIVITIYYLYRSFGNNRLKDVFFFLIKMLIPLAMSMVLILPTFSILFSNREVGSSVEFLKLLIPQFPSSGFFYSPYGLGVIGLFGIALIDNILAKEKKNRYLGILLLLLLVMPIFQYILNGTLYVETKVMIPFLPLFVILTGETLEQFHTKRMVTASLILVLLIVFNHKNVSDMQVVLVIELVLSVLILYVREKTKWEGLLYIFVGIALVVSIQISGSDELVKKEDYHVLRNQGLKINEYVRQNNNMADENNVTSIDNANFIPYIGYYSDTIYSSLINQQYVHFHTKTINSPHSSRNNATFNSTDNIIMETLMGVKYIKTETPSIGYKPYRGKYYSNDNVLPLGYVNSKLVSLESFEDLDSAFRSDVMINKVAVKEGEKAAKSSVREKELKYQVIDSKDIEIEGSTYKAKKNGSYLRVKFDEDLDNKILILNIKLKYTKWNNRADQKIWVNNVLNTQTSTGWKYNNKNNANGFNYVLSNLKNNEIMLYLDRGFYDIDRIKTYLLDYDEIKNINQKIDPFNISSIKGDVIKGDIDVTEDGYFVFQVPYDENYKIYVDGKQTKYERVNSDFVGFKLGKGQHKVRIEYKAAGLQLGLALSVIGTLMFFVLWFRDRKQYRKRQKKSQKSNRKKNQKSNHKKNQKNNQKKNQKKSRKKNRK